MKTYLAILIGFLGANEALAHSGHPAVSEAGMLHYLTGADHLVVLMGIALSLILALSIPRAKAKRLATATAFVLALALFLI